MKKCKNMLEVHRISVDEFSRAHVADMIMGAHKKVFVITLHQSEITKNMKVSGIKRAPETIWVIIVKGSDKALTEKLDQLPPEMITSTEVDSTILSDPKVSWENVDSKSNAIKKIFKHDAVEAMKQTTLNNAPMIIIDLIEMLFTYFFTGVSGQNII